MHTLPLSTLGDALRRKEFSSVELTKHFLDRIAIQDPALNAFITVTGDVALTDAARADERRRAGEDGPLLGIPIAHKDIFCTRGVRTSCGSRMLDSFIAPYDATVVERLRAGGAVMLGKTNMDEFAMGSSQPDELVRPGPQPLGSAARPGRIVRRFRRRRRGRPRPRRHGHRNRRLDPPAGRPHRIDRTQADLWPGLQVRDGGVCLESRSSRTPRAQRRGRRAVARRGRGTRPQGFDVGRSSGGRLSGRARVRSLGDTHRGREGAVRRGTRSRGRKAGRGSDPRSRSDRGDALRHLAPEQRPFHSRVLRGRSGRSVFEPVPLRRRALRPPHGTPPRRSRRPVQAHPERRIRRRSQAPDHDRHLRALGRLL